MVYSTDAETRSPAKTTPRPVREHQTGDYLKHNGIIIMSQADTNMAQALATAKTITGKGKAKTAPQQAPAPARTAQPQGRTVVTLETARRICPSEGVATKISTLYGLDVVDFHAIRETTEEHMVKMAQALEGSLNDKALEMHMQRIVDSFVRSAHGAGNFYDGKAAIARQLTSAIANEDRDEDRQGIDGTANKAQRACEFAAQVGLQAYALLAAAQGAVDAYAHVTGQDWKPYEGMTAPSQTVTRQALTHRAGAFDRE